MSPNAAHVPVEDPWPSGPVLLGTDLGDASAGAEAAAVAMAAERGVPLVILSVIDPGGLRLPGGAFHSRVDQVRSRREAAALRVVESARSHGVPARFLIWEGSPGESICEVAQAEAAGTIVVGSHNRGRVGRLLLGSVSSYVVKHADRPVVVIPPNAGADAADSGGSVRPSGPITNARPL
jgi:nucleotide-binding universal stress UspA family protein